MHSKHSLFILAYLAMVLIYSCELTPTRPEDVFTVYRERMRRGEVIEARKLLFFESSSLALLLASKYKLDSPPENIAILNVLDPQTSPTPTVVEDTFALLNVRTIRGTPKMIRLVRQDAKSAWKINLNEELTALQTFLEAQAALETMREKAGDYAASWKAFNDQLERINIIDEPASKQGQKAQKQPPSKKPALRKGNLDKGSQF